MGTAGKVAAGLAIASTLYALAVRPRILRWGATDDEVRQPFPGADLILDGTRSATMATTLDAPTDRVWPWLAQMGLNHGGWYSWDQLDNWGRSSARTLHPEWQSIKVGDHLAAMPDGSMWWEVAALDPGRFLCLRMSLDLLGRPFDPMGPRPRYFTDSTWGFLLNDASGGRTRLVVSGYWSLHPTWLQPLASALFLELQHFVMQLQQFRNLKHRVERNPDDAARFTEQQLAAQRDKS